MINCRRLLIIAIFLGTICVSFFTPSSNANETKRGDIPACQQECLNKHIRRMELALSEYDKNSNRIEYQDLVETEANNYMACLNNCHIPMPVK